MSINSIWTSTEREITKFVTHFLFSRAYEINYFWLIRLRWPQTWESKRLAPTVILSFILICMQDMWTGGHAVAHLVEALRRKPEGRGCDSRGAIGIFHWHNPSGCTMALRSSQSLTEISTSNISWERVKGGRCLGSAISPPSCADCLEIWEP
jgi:hypothetical protein